MVFQERNPGRVKQEEDCGVVSLQTCYDHVQAENTDEHCDSYGRKKERKSYEIIADCPGKKLSVLI